MKKTISVLLAMILVLSMLSGCGVKVSDAGPEKTETAESSTDTDGTQGEAAPVTVDFSKTDADMFTERDTTTAYDTNKAIIVHLNGTTAVASSDGVTISGPSVTLTEDATYVISGELSDGMLIVNAPSTAKPHVVLNGVSITSRTSAALYVSEADKVIVTLAEGTVNTLENGGGFASADIDAPLFSKQDLTLNGTGALTVTSPAGHGVVCKDDLVITGGAYRVNAASHGLNANDSVRIAAATLAVNAGKDAIHCENSEDASKGFVYLSSGTIQAEAAGDGIAASAYMQIASGTIDLLVGGGSENGAKEHADTFGNFMGGGRPGGMHSDNMQNSTAEAASTSMKGLKAANSLLISDGNITINSADDAIHSNVSVVINGGTFTIASGDDAVHAEEILTVTAGKIDISECYEGLEALHIDLQGGEIKLKASDDGLNAAGGVDQSGTTGGRDGMFGGRPNGGGGMASNANGSIKVAGGNLYIHSSGDGMDANGTLEISGGHITIVGPTQGDTATLDYDKSAVITGGTFIGTGAAGMAQSFSDSAQGVVALRVGNQNAGTNILLINKDGNTIIEYAPELSFAVVILSTPEIKSGETYTITVGSMSGEFKAN